MKTVSIIIPTYNRARFIGLTLESFATQNYPAGKFEIIVINNNSTDRTAEVVLEMSKKYPVIKYFEEPRQGVHYARNAAINFAFSDILYYTDDDMIAEKSLLTTIVSTFDRDPNIACVSGRVLPMWEIDPPEWVVKYCTNGLLSLNTDDSPLIVSNQMLNIYSCHQAILRSAFLHSGGFNPENTKGEWIGDGETGLAIKILKLGYKLAYNGNAIIHHIIPPSRMTQVYLNKRLANQGNCDSYTAYRKKNGLSKNELFQQIKTNFGRLIYKCLSSAWNFVKGSPHYRLLFAEIFYYRNRIKYDYRLIHDRNWQKLVLKENWLDVNE